MKRLRFLLLTALLLLGAGLAERWLARFELAALFGGRTDWKLAYVPAAKLSTVYLADAAWITFPVPAGTRQLKLIAAPNTTAIAALRQQRTLDPLQRWKYAIEIEALDGQGRRALLRTHHLRADLAEFRDPAGRTITPTFYLGEALTPLVSSVVQINLNGLPPVTRLRLRLHAKDPELAEISLRLYVPEKKAERQIGYLWSRLNTEARERMAKGNVFAHELLLEEERLNLLRNSWQPTGPLGTRDVDYRQRDLYVLNDYEGEPLEDPVPPVGLLFGGAALASIPLPEAGGRVRIELRATSSASSASPPAAGRAAGAAAAIPVELRWAGPGPYARKTVRFDWRPGAADFVADFAGGWLVLAAPRELVARIYLGEDRKAIEITPETTYDRPFAVSAAAPLEYALRHGGSAPLPLRVVFRSLRAAAPGEAAPPAAPSPTAVRYQFLDAQSGVLSEKLQAVDGLPSPFDQVLGEPKNIRVSEPTMVYFAVPDAAVRLRFLPAGADADAPTVLVSVANRPAGLPQQVSFPTDRFGYDPLQQKTPLWFPLRPTSYDEHLRAGRSRLLVVQSRPPEDRPELQSGAFQWEDLPPDGNAPARQLFSPREPGAPLRDDALPASFAPFAPNASHSFDFPSIFGLKVISPRLAWVAAGNAPWAGEVWIDGRLHQRVRGAAGYGETELLPLSAGRHRLQVVTDRALRLFVSHARVDGETYLARLAVQARARQTYRATLRGGEELTLRLFAPAGESGASRLRIRIAGPPPKPYAAYDGWLIGEREVVLRPARSAALPVFDTGGQAVDAGQPVFFSIPGGAAGAYRIDVELQDGPGGYLLMSSLNAELRPKRRLLNEPSLENSLEIHE